MKPEIKKLWLEALRSGEYKQAQKFLGFRSTGQPERCCLGVLCDLSPRPLLPSGPIMVTQRTEDSRTPDNFIRMWAGLTQGPVRELADLNDAGEPDNYASVIEYIEGEL